ncbi:TonB-dependent siderophore receptor [Halomonas salipaludis]|uniref:TonB-dependent siderophore receptor n=2 Tax=Halomonas salipaludis TaxID=2032625 RepID=A0A2A2ERR0_9GAMM|nr:TonB-dependent siderophore receptor [Halomonas salipaludis]
MTALAQQTSQQQVQQYDIPPGPVSSALNRFAAQASIYISGAGALGEGRQSPGLQGQYGVDEGLQRLLAGTGLAAVRQGDGGYRLDYINRQVDQSLETVSVYGTLPARYEARYADSSVRLPKDIIDVPRSIDVIPEQFLLDQQAREMADAFRLSPNVVVADGYGGTREHSLIRGFNRNDNFYRNGVPFSHESRIDPATIDNIQLIKGPVADIGRMSPGGIVNIETKQPQFQREHSISTTFDEHGQRRGTIDLTGPVGESQNLAYRITGSLEDSETFRDTNVDRQFLSSALLWQADSGASVGFNHEYSKDRREIDRGLITVPMGDLRRRLADVPFDTRFDGNIPNERNSEYHLAELDVVIPLADSAWEIDNKLFYSRETGEDLRAEVISVGADVSSELTEDTLIRRVGANQNSVRTYKFARSQLIGAIDTAIPIRVAAGVEYREFSHEWRNLTGAPQIGGSVSSPNSFTLINDLGSPSSDQFYDVSQKSHGMFSSTEFSLTDTVTLDLGLRYEISENNYHNDNYLTGSSTDIDSGSSSKLTKGLGLVWETTPGLNLYLSYADTFEPQNIYVGSQEVFEQDPSEGRQVEAGVKWSSADNRYFITGAVFDLREDNVVETINGEPVPTGGITSKGAEFSIAANPVDGFNLRGAVGLLDAKIVSDNEATNGNQPRNVPDTTASLWASYEFRNPASALRGLGIGSGITYASNRYGDNGHRNNLGEALYGFELGDYTVVDAGLWYYLPVGNGDRLRFDLGVKNVTDEEYIVASGGNTRISVGDPRTFYSGIRFEF